MPPSKRILLVEDNLSLLDLWTRALTEAGYQVIACDGFERARDSLDRMLPDAVVTDVRLGPFNGLQLVLLAKAVEPQIQAIVLTGYDDPVLRQEAERAGACYLLKPIAAEQLSQILGPA